MLASARVRELSQSPMSTSQRKPLTVRSMQAMVSTFRCGLRVQSVLVTEARTYSGHLFGGAGGHPYFIPLDNNCFYSFDLRGKPWKAHFRISHH